MSGRRGNPRRSDAGVTDRRRDLRCVARKSRQKPLWRAVGAKAGDDQPVGRR